MLENILLANKPIIKSKFLNNQEIYNLSTQTFQLPNENFNYRIIEVTEDYIARPDLISQMVYGVDKYGDILCKINGISNPFELNVGDRLVVPEINDLNKFVYDNIDTKTESSENLEDEESVENLPKAKMLNEKRKPNEAIIGEKRFKIDRDRRVIIY